MLINLSIFEVTHTKQKNFPTKNAFILSRSSHWISHDMRRPLLKNIEAAHYYCLLGIREMSIYNSLNCLCNKLENIICADGKNS